MSTVVAELPLARNRSVLLPAVFILALLAVAFAPRIAGGEALFHAHVLAFSLLIAWFTLLVGTQTSGRLTFRFRLNIAATHYVQALVQLSIFVSWSLVWELIFHNGLLIVSQLLFAYAFDALLNWSRGKTWRLGFGPFPIIFSINLFLCFKDDWFVYQFALIAVGFLAKEFITWTRDGRRRHIFNPSAITLFLYSLVLIITNNTNLTWAEELAVRLNDPDNIYLHILLVGLIVQLLFYVTLVTLAAGLTLFVLNIVYTTLTGVHWFLDAGIPIAVFLGIHLLITDPATSPRTSFGRFLFGCLYGAGVFALYGLLEYLGEPRFYDKLLVVPLLNLLVIQLDRIGSSRPIAKISRSRWAVVSLSRLGARATNALHMSAWVLLFAVMYGTGFVGPRHEGQSTMFWQRACDADKRNGCRNLAALYRNGCHAGNAPRCHALAELYEKRPALGTGNLDVVYAYAAACDFGSVAGCREFIRRYDSSLSAKLMKACVEDHEALGCYVLAGAYLRGLGEAVDLEQAFELYSKGCEQGHPISCSITGDMYLYGLGVGKNVERAIVRLREACRNSYGPACHSLGNVFESGVDADIDLSRAKWYRRKACALGFKDACGGDKTA